MLVLRCLKAGPHRIYEAPDRGDGTPDLHWSQSLILGRVDGDTLVLGLGPAFVLNRMPCRSQRAALKPTDPKPFETGSYQ